MLIDSQGYCHAVGVILDGQACGGEDPARGSRYNNAVRYLESEAPQAVVVVYSADGGIDVLPRIRPRVKQSRVQQAVDQYLSLATPGKRQSGRADAWEQVRRLMFYLSEDQCRVLNEARAALNRWAEEHDYFVEIVQPLAPNPDMNGTYWLPRRVEPHLLANTPAVDRDLVAEAPRTVGRADEIDLRQRGRPFLLRLPESADGGNP